MSSKNFQFQDLSFNFANLRDQIDRYQIPIYKFKIVIEFWLYLSVGILQFHVQQQAEEEVEKQK